MRLLYEYSDILVTKLRLPMAGPSMRLLFTEVALCCWVPAEFRECHLRYGHDHQSFLFSLERRRFEEWFVIFNYQAD